jgi:hypothetical protein
MAFAGTKITITIMDTISTLISKSDEVSTLRLPENFASAYLNTTDDVLNFIGTHIDHSLFRLEDKTELLEKLIGRRRLSANFILELWRLMTEQQDEEDYNLLAITAGDNTYNAIVRDLAKRLQEQWSNDPTGSKSQLHKY